MSGTKPQDRVATGVDTPVTGQLEVAESEPSLGNMPPAWARLALATAAGLYVASFLGVALSRLTYPYELEWTTGSMLDHVGRACDGQPIYVAPSPNYVPALYSPLYYYVSAGVAQLTGLGFLPARLVSLAATLGCGALVFAVLRRETNRALPAWIGVGLFAATYGLVETWYDIARPDSLFMLLSMAGLTALWRGTSNGTALLAAVLMTLAYLTKQTALLLAPPFAVAAGIYSWRRGLVFLAGFGASWGIAVWALDRASDGWFWFYTWTLPLSHGYHFDLLLPFFTEDMVLVAPMAGLSVWLLVRFGCTGRPRKMVAYGAWSAGLVVSGLLSRLHVGGAINVLIPTYMALALLAPIALREAGSVGRWVMPIVLLLQFALLVYDPRPFVPSEADRRAGDALVKLIRNTDGDVMIPLHGYWARQAGKTPRAHGMAVMDVVRAVDARTGEQLEADYYECGRANAIELIILSDPGVNQFLPFVSTGYRGCKILSPDDGDVMMPVVGLKVRPHFVFQRSH